MNKWKKVSILISLCLIFFCIVAARYSRYLSPRWIEMQSGDSFALRVSDTSSVDRYQINTYGSFAVYNASGDTVYGITIDGKPELSTKAAYLNTNTAAEYIAASSAYDHYFIYMDTTCTALVDSRLTGVSFYLPAGTAALDGFKVRLVNLTSGTTDLMITPADDAVRGSGITDHIVDISGTTYATGTESAFSYNVLDSQFDWIEYVYQYVSTSGGTWWQSGVSVSN